MSKSHKFGFSLIELSVVIIVIGILVIGITQGSRIISGAKIKSANSLTSGSPVTSISNLSLWIEVTDQQNLKSSAVASISTTDYGNISDGSLISAWNDRNQQSTSKITLSAPGDSKRPVYLQNGINNLPSISFTRASSQRLSSSIVPITEGSTNYTMIAVFRPTTSLAATNYVFAQSPVTSTASRQGSIFLNTTSIGFSGVNNDYMASSLALNTNYIVVIRVNNSLANNVTVYTNGTPSTGASVTPASLNIGAEVITVGARTGASGHFDGLISEIIVYNRALNNTEISSINSYLSTKYAIKLN
jgi:prepilin-type N-terminal cleavage/methylation domain-containing protein